MEYLGKVAPDIAPQIDFLKKFHKFLLGIFHDIQRDKELWKLKIMVHGDSKVDNLYSSGFISVVHAESKYFSTLPRILLVYKSAVDVLIFLFELSRISAILLH